MSQRTASACSATRPSAAAARLAQAGCEGVHLDHVGPGCEVGVLPVGEDRAVDLDERPGTTCEVLGRAAHERLRGGPQPRRVRPDVVGHPVHHQQRTPSAELRTGAVQARPAAESGRRLVVGDAVRRPDHVGAGPVRQCRRPARPQIRVGQGDLTPRRAARPDTHQPDHGHPVGDHQVPFRGRHGPQRDAGSESARHLTQPDGGVDLVDDGMCRPLQGRSAGPSQGSRAH